MSYKVTLEKGKNNMIGISIGGGAPFCPTVYIVQVFHRTPAYEDGSLCPGDELVSVNNKSLKGFSRKQTADMIQSEKGQIVIAYNRIHPPKEKAFDISLKKFKHKVVEKMRDSTADTLGITRAVLVNDKLLKKLNHLESTSAVYRGIAQHTRYVLIQTRELSRAHREMGDVFCSIGVYEKQKSASVAFTNFGGAHKQMADEGDKLLKRAVPMLKDLHTFLTKAVPDTKLTIKRYQEAKFEFLAYCLKIKELDDEEYEFSQTLQPLPRVLTGNLEYRVLLRCRHASKAKFMKLRSDVLVKLQLLDNKRVQDIAFQLERLVAGLYVYCRQSYKVLKPVCIFPIEVELQLENIPPIKPSSAENEENKTEKDDSSDEELLSAEHEETQTEEQQVVTDDLISI